MTGPPAAPTHALLQGVQAEGGPTIAVAATFLAIAVGFPLSLWIAWRLYAGYRGSGDRSMLALAVGLVLVTTVPTTVRVVVPTALGGEPTVRIVASSASELAGLLAILLAIRRPARHRRRVDGERRSALGPVLVGHGVLLDRVGLLATGATGLVGAYVSWQAYRGYRRNESAPMFWLAAGIALLTVLPFAWALALGELGAASDATILLAQSLSQVAGLLAVLYSLVRA